MRATPSHYRRAVLFKLFVPPLLLMLPLLLLGSNLVEAGPKPQTASPIIQARQAGDNATVPTQLVLRVYFRNTAERDKLASQLDTLEVPTVGGYLTVVSDQAGLDTLRKEGLRVEIDAKQTANLNTNVKFGNTSDNFFGGYHTVEEMGQFI